MIVFTSRILYIIFSMWHIKCFYLLRRAMVLFLYDTGQKNHYNEQFIILHLVK